MRTVFSFAAMLAWGLWFGGLCTLVVLVLALQRGSDPVGPKAAPYLFLAFERLELIVAALAVVAALGWRLVHKHSLVTFLFVLFVLSSAGAVGKHFLLTPKMKPYWESSNTKNDEFRGLHQASSIIYVTQAGVLLIGGLILPSILRRDVALVVEPKAAE